MEHSVNVLYFAEARASEIASMMDEMNSSKKKLAFFQRLPHYMRRRAASQNPNRVPKKLQEANKQGQSKVHKKYKKKNKQGRFAHKDLHYTWLETHIWHAKRFKMETLWGYRVPIHANDRKIGTSHRGATRRCIAQDLSYYCCIELEGLQSKLLSKLSSLINPKYAYSFDSNIFLDGSKEGRCYLYQPNSAPFKAIGPVTFLWEPIPSHVKKECRKLWIWCHPSFHDELVQVFADVFNLTKLPPSTEDDSKYAFACKLNSEKTKHHFGKEDRYTSSDSPVTMTLLRNTLSRHRLMGPTASQVLSRVMRIAVVDKLSSSSATLEQEDGNAVKKMKHSDSYWWEAYYVNNEGNKSILAEQKKVLDFLKNIDCHSYVDPWSVVSLTVRDPRCGHHWSEYSASEDSESSMPPSNVENLNVADVAPSPLWNRDIRNEVTATKMSEIKLNEEKEKCVVAPDLGDRENRVPVILIHRPHLNGMGYGWDVIVPLGWSLEFWRGYTKSGSLPTALRDLHFVNLEAGRPNFPRSFPDTSAGKQEHLTRETQGFSELHRHPKSQRPNFTALGVPTPFTVHWEVLLKDGLRELENSDSLPETLKKTVAGMISECDDFHVLKELRELSSFTFRTKKAGKCQSALELQKLLHNIDDFLTSILKCETQLFKSLVLVKVDSFNKGTPSEHAGLYLLSAEDILSLRENRNFPGPVEPPHPHKPEKNQKKKDSKTKKTDSVEKPKIDTYIDSCSRKMIGYISEGCFSSTCGHGIGIGHCTSLGFVSLLKQCAESCLKPVVLYRNQHTYQFRVANIELIEDYM